MDASHLRSCVYRYDRFQDAFEHVSTVIDDIYKVWLLVCTVCVYSTVGVCFFVNNYTWCVYVIAETV